MFDGRQLLADSRLTRKRWPEPRLRRITVKVGGSPEALTLASLEGFIRQPAEQQN